MNEFLQHFVNGLSLGSIYALIALGYTMVYGILKLINFAHADVYMVGAFAAFYINKWLEPLSLPFILHFGILVLFSMGVCVLLALLMERLAYRPLRKAPKINVLITAIGLSLLLQFSGQIIFGADPKFFPQIIENKILFTLGQVHLRQIDCLVFGMTFFVLFIVRYYIFKTRDGKAMRAVSQNSEAASLLGISPNRIIGLTFAIGALLAAIASILVSLKYPKIEPMMGTLMGLKAFVAAVLGGIGSLPGAVLGAFIMGLSEEMVVAYFSSTYRDALAFLILIIVLLIKPTGLLGSKGAEKV